MGFKKLLRAIGAGLLIVFVVIHSYKAMMIQVFSTDRGFSHTHYKVSNDIEGRELGILFLPDNYAYMYYCDGDDREYFKLKIYGEYGTNIFMGLFRTRRSLKLVKANELPAAIELHVEEKKILSSAPAFKDKEVYEQVLIIDKDKQYLTLFDMKLNKREYDAKLKEEIDNQFN